MAWRFIEHPALDLDVVDVDALNGNLQNFAEEVNGSLNEHNTAGDALDAVAEQWADNIGLTLTHDWEPRDPSVAAVSGAEIDQSTQWVPCGTLEFPFTTRGGKVRVVACFQLVNNTADPTAVKQPGLNFAVAIDGVVQYESLLGSGDLTNDYVEPGNEFGYSLSGTHGTGPGVRQFFASIALEWVGRVAPGAHTVRVVARNLSTVNDALVQYVAQEEIGVVEMNA